MDIQVFREMVAKKPDGFLATISRNTLISIGFSKDSNVPEPYDSTTVQNAYANQGPITHGKSNNPQFGFPDCTCSQKGEGSFSAVS